MAGSLMLFPNPRNRRRKARRSSAARRPMTAKQLRYFGPRRGKRRRAKAATVIVATRNPKRRTAMAKRRRRHTAKRRASRRVFAKNPTRRHHRRARRRTYRRNPIGGSMGGFIDGTLMPAAFGAAGAVGVDLVMGMATPMLPPSMTQGAMLPLIRVGAALALGYAVSQFGNEKMGEQVAAGGIIVALYGAAKSFLATNAPTLPLARYVPMGYVGPARTMGAIRNRRMAMRRRRLGLMRQRRAMMLSQGGGMAGMQQTTRSRAGRGMSRYVGN